MIIRESSDYFTDGSVFQSVLINDEIWLPAETRFTFSGRLLLLKGGSIDATTEYSNYKKFTVETQVKFPAVKKP